MERSKGQDNLVIYTKENKTVSASKSEAVRHVTRTDVLESKKDTVGKEERQESPDPVAMDVDAVLEEMFHWRDV